MGSRSGNVLQVVAKNFDVLALPLVTLLYPLLASIRAIESRSQKDSQQWLTYWVLYSMTTLFELTFAQVLECIPIWSLVKLISSCWLVLPTFNGAAYVYQRYVRPFYTNPRAFNGAAPHLQWSFPMAGFSKRDDVVTAAERYIEENGTDAFEKLIAKSTRSTTAHYFPKKK